MAIQRAFDWYRFATQNLQRQICNHSLYLITGFYKARSWSLASFQNASPGVSGNSALIRAIKVGEGSDSGNYRWESTFHIDWNDGPRRGRNGGVNQSVFLRGFKIAVRDDIFGLWTQPVVEAVPRPNSPGVAKCSCLSFLTRQSRKKRTYKPGAVKDSNPNPGHVPQLSQVGIFPVTSDAAIDCSDLLALPPLGYHQPLFAEPGLWLDRYTMYHIVLNLLFPGSCRLCCRDPRQ